MQLDAMKPPVTGRAPTLLEILLTGGLGAVDHSGKSAAAFAGGLTQGIDQKANEANQRQQYDQQRAGIMSQGLEKNAAFDMQGAQLGYQDAMQNDALKAKRDMFDAEQAGKVELAKLAQAGKLTVAQAGLLMRLPPEARPMAAQKMGIYDADTISALGSLTPDEQNKLASAGKSNADAAYTAGAKTDNTNANTGLTKAKTVTENQSRAAKVENLIKAGKLMDANTENVKTLAPYRQSMLGLLGQNYASQINHRDVQDAQAWKRIDISERKITQGKAPDVKSLQKAVDTLDESYSALTTEADVINNQLHRFGEDGDLADEGKFAKAQDARAINQNKMRLNREKIKKAKDILATSQQIPAGNPTTQPKQASGDLHTKYRDAIRIALSHGDQSTANTLKAEAKAKGFNF